MLKSGLFSVIFKVDEVEMREEYQLAYRTEEERIEGSTLYQQTKSAIGKNLGIKRNWIDIVKIMRIHNDLIVEE